MSTVAVIVIGRNEGERLKRCLLSVRQACEQLVYVDSGSSDGSCEFAASVQAHVISLDMSRPFSAARARNAGLELLAKLTPRPDFVQFIDGDCEMFEAWLPQAQRFLTEHKAAAAACGRLRERHPERSVYNWLCDLEWNTPVGQAKACGGIALMRVQALLDVGGFREDVIAGEEPELCVRLRAAQWQIWRLDMDMAWHDAAMHSFRQWWLRSVRSGYAFALGAKLHGAPPERHWVWETRRAVIWGGLLPACTIALAVAWTPWALALTMLFPTQAARIALKSPLPAREAWLDALFKVLGRFAEMQGILRFLRDRIGHRAATIIEYK